MEFLPRLQLSELEPTDALRGTTDILVRPSLGAQQKVFIRGPSSTARPSVGSTPRAFTFFPISLNGEEDQAVLGRLARHGFPTQVESPKTSPRSGPNQRRSGNTRILTFWNHASS